ncbi:ribokinase [Paraphotobacterium marinum]|uniref:Ribokinase n=1 Tax=Paraphotobacterium marinum TaxID=1755811 RepID=A0A220VGR1_9GAMM|nr:ribokinase [Paraphotobacterium marinum]ASK79519.1 ribokinase [Paraphotobacterium marinum]
MKKHERIKIISDQIRIKGQVSLFDLSQQFNVTIRTIRNDLKELQTKIGCEIFRGGAKKKKINYGSLYTSVYNKNFNLKINNNYLSTQNDTKSQILNSSQSNTDDYKKIFILGSFNIDICVEVDDFASIGETLAAESINYYSGGKGTNQATAASCISDKVHLTVKIGSDALSFKAQEFIKNIPLMSRTVLMDNEYSTGQAVIVSAKKAGNNKVYANLGANLHITLNEIEQDLCHLDQSDILLTQLENNFDVTKHLIQRAHNQNILVVLDPSPLNLNCIPLLQQVDIILPNQVEASKLSNIEILNYESAKEAAYKIHGMGPKHVIIKMSKDGCVYFNGEKFWIFPTYKSYVVDTCGAGDAFAGAFVGELSRGKTIKESIKFANSYASLKIERKGASNMPKRELAISRLLEKTN